MILNFCKMQGCGNDYIYFDCFKQVIENPEKLSIKLSNRHYGIGGDGIILICPSEKADAKMSMFNSDGSEGKMCGNGIRCVGKYLFDNKIVNGDYVTIETLSGIKTLKAYKTQNCVTKLCVDMGKVEFDPKKIPVNISRKKIIKENVIIGNKSYNITCVSLGNPHCIVFCDNLEDLNIEYEGKLFENSPLFPEGINTEFIKITDENAIEMRVWERGSGETMACGTGACAAAVAAVENGYFKKGININVKLKGGNLSIKYTDKTVYMTGDAEKTFEGIVKI